MTSHIFIEVAVRKRQHPLEVQTNTHSFHKSALYKRKDITRPGTFSDYKD
jgi:hypothetical protein